MEWEAVIAGLITIAGLLVKKWLENSPERKKEAENEAIQKGRVDLHENNIDAIRIRISSVLDDETAAGNCDAGSKSGIPDTGPVSIKDRLSAFDIGVNKAS